MTDKRLRTGVTLDASLAVLTDVNIEPKCSFFPFYDSFGNQLAVEFTHNSHTGESTASAGRLIVLAESSPQTPDTGAFLYTSKLPVPAVGSGSPVIENEV